MTSGIPRDPLTGRAILGGRLQRAQGREHFRWLIPVQGATVVHWLDLRGLPNVVCGMVEGARAVPATSRARLCRSCLRVARERGWL